MSKHYKKIMCIVSALLVLAVSAVFYNRHATSTNLQLVETTFDHLPAWKKDDQSQALLAFQHSCRKMVRRNNPAAFFSSFVEGGKVSDWQTICVAALQLTKPDTLQARQFFQTWFVPYKVIDPLHSQGLFTGYYLPLLHASLTQDKHYSVPIYGLPNDLVKVDLTAFSDEWAGKKMVGQLKNQILLPYPDRAAITGGAISHHAPVLLWGENAADVFFAQIQGSALVELPDHQQRLIGYAGDNGRVYTPIGKVLIDNKAIPRNEMSMQTIRAWLAQHPLQINTILNNNASYVFFKLLTTNAPLGTQHVPLTPQRSLAVDTRYIPLGAPLWLDTLLPPTADKIAYQRLVIAQDTGGAIRGMIRGDIYWGAGDRAAFTAGHMNSPGQYWILLPRKK